MHSPKYSNRRIKEDSLATSLNVNRGAKEKQGEKQQERQQVHQDEDFNKDGKDSESGEVIGA